MKIEVVAFPRAQQGTGASRRLRATGRVPGIIYGADKPAQTVELDQRALLRHLKMEAFHASILDMTVDSTREQVLLRDFQMHPWKSMVLHVINADICPGVKVGGGVVQHVRNDIEIQCLPADLPEFIEVDLKDLQLGESIHVTELTLPKGVEATPKLQHDNPSVVTVQVPREIAIEEEAAAPVTEIISQAPAEGEAGAEAAPAEKKEAEKKESAKKE
jgi:large subunit ribosomal protein L25